MKFNQPLDLPTLASLKQHPLTWLIVGVSVLCFVLSLEFSRDLYSALLLPQRMKALLVTHEYWRLWTPVFVHFSVFHLLTNVYCWWLFASRVEAQSKIELLLIFVVVAALSNSAEWIAAGPQFGGLSGLVYALLSYCWLLSHFKFVPTYSTPLTLNIVLLLSLPLAATGMFGHFANTAHVLGLLSGVLCAFVSAIIRHRKIKSQSNLME